MSILLNLYPGDEWCILFAIVLLQVTVVIVLAWLLSWLLGRWNPALRYTIYLVALGCTLGCPLVAGVMHTTSVTLLALQSPGHLVFQREIPGTPIVSTADDDASSLPASSPAVAIPVAAGREHELPPARAETPRRSATDILRTVAGAGFLIWLLGASLLLARWCHGLHLVATLRRELEPLACSALDDALRQVRNVLGTEQLPRLTTSRVIDRPIMVGLKSPLIILPNKLVDAIQPAELADVLIHECAHVICRHQIVGVLQRLAGTLFWPHPLVHVLNGELARAREEVCDNFVLRQNSACRYARTLLDLSQSLSGLSPQPLTLGLLHNSWKLEDRVAGLLDRRRKTMIHVRPRTTAVLIVMLLAPTLLIAATKVQAAGPDEPRTVDKLVRDLPAEVDASTPESALAAWSQSHVLKDAQALVDLSWATLDPAAMEFALENLEAATAEKMLDVEIVQVLTYHDDLAAVIYKNATNPGELPYGVVHLGRSKDQWKILGLLQDGKEWKYQSPSLAAAEERFAKDREELWQAFVALRDGATPTATGHSISAKQLEEIKQWQKKTWQIELRLEMPSLDPQAVQYALFDKDPLPTFQAHVREMQEHTRQQLENADTEAWKDIVRVTNMSIAWDNVFKTVTGENLSLLTARNGRVISSNGPEVKRWIVSKTVNTAQGPVCWCMPVDVKRGEKVTVTFNEGNVFDLRAAYEEALKEPASEENQNK